MDNETKEIIQIIISMLRNACTENKVSVAFDKKSHKLLFFDTDKYLESKTFDGFEVNLRDLVN